MKKSHGFLRKFLFFRTVYRNENQKALYFYLYWTKNVPIIFLLFILYKKINEIKKYYIKII